MFELLRRRRVFCSLIAITSLAALSFLALPPAYLRTRSGPEEIHALLHYVVHKPERPLPPLDPSQPVAFQLYEDGDVEKADWAQRASALDSETPLVVFSKTYCLSSRRAKDVLARYDLLPAPKILEVDLRPDGEVLKSLLIRLTSRRTFPNLMLQGKTLGGYDDLWALHQAGELSAVFEKAGMTVRGGVDGTSGAAA